MSSTKGSVVFDSASSLPCSIQVNLIHHKNKNNLRIMQFGYNFQYMLRINKKLTFLNSTTELINQ